MDTVSAAYATGAQCSVIGLSSRGSTYSSTFSHKEAVDMTRHSPSKQQLVGADISPAHQFGEKSIKIDSLLADAVDLSRIEDTMDTDDISDTPQRADDFVEMDFEPAYTLPRSVTSMDLGFRSTQFWNSSLYTALRSIHKNALCNLWDENSLPCALPETKTRLNQLRDDMLPPGVTDPFNLRKLCFLHDDSTLNKTRMLCSLFETFPPVDVAPCMSNLVQELICVPQFGICDKPIANADIFGDFDSSGAPGAVCIICKLFLTVSGGVGKRFVHHHVRQDPVTFLFF